MKLPGWTRSPRLGYALAAFTYVFGFAWRYYHIFVFHKPRDFVYSDMGMYVGLGKRLARPGYQLQPYDVTHPPGLSELIAHFYKTDPDLDNLVRFQFLVTVAVPLLVGLLGWLTFDRKAGAWAVVLSSLYLPFVDFGGYFLAEIYLTFTATVTMVLYLGAVRVASPTTNSTAALRAAAVYREGVDKPPTTKQAGLLSIPRARLAIAIAMAALAGFVFSLAMVMKMVAVPALFCFFGIYVLFTRTPATWKTKAVLLAVLLVGAAPLSRWQADRCTRGNQGKFCPGSNKAPADFLMGHIGRVQSVTWVEPNPKNPDKPRGQVNFGSPAAYQHGYQEKAKFYFKITDGEDNKKAAWDWIGKHPGQAIVLSFEHVWDSFGGSLPWPSVATRVWAGSQAYHYMFIAFLLFPTMVLLLDVARRRGIKAFMRSIELAVFAPILGVVVSVMLATGEVRYRIPWDMCFMILSVQFFRSLFDKEDKGSAPPLPAAPVAETMAPQSESESKEPHPNQTAEMDAPEIG